MRIYYLNYLKKIYYQYVMCCLFCARLYN